MRILTDENIFKSSYFKNICPGYEQFFEPEKLFLRLTDDPAEIKHRQDILRDLLDNPTLFEDLCFLSDTIAFYTTSFDDMPSRGLGDFRLNLERFEDAGGAIELIDRFLRAAEYAKQYPWLSDFAVNVGQFAQRRSAEKMTTIWEQAFVPEAVMHACDFGFNFDEILWPVTYKLLTMREDEYTKKNTPYHIFRIKEKFTDRLFCMMKTMGEAQQVKNGLLDNEDLVHNDYGNDDLMDDEVFFGKEAAEGRAKVQYAAVNTSKDMGENVAQMRWSDDYFYNIVAIDLLKNRSTSDAPIRIKFFVTTLISELEPLVTEFIPYLCAAKTALYWREKGVPYCIPEIGNPGEINLKGIINPYIAQNEGVDATIENNVTLNGEIAVVTGANRGGKTAFVTSVTLCQILFQLGFPIPAKSAKLGVFNGIVSVFAGEEQGLIGTGRLGEELKKLADGLKTSRAGNTFICFNEPLTGTSSRDGERILAEALCMLKEAGASGFVVTHLLGLAKALDTINKAGGSPLTTLTAQTDGEKPLYKIVPAPPAESSHAKAVVSRFIS